GPPLLAEAVARVRRGAVIREAGYDGEYGIIRVFTPDELHSAPPTGTLFDPPPTPAPPVSARPTPEPHPLVPGPPEREGSPAAGVGGAAVHTPPPLSDPPPPPPAPPPPPPAEAAPVQADPAPSDPANLDLLAAGVLGGLDPEQRVAAGA